MFFVNTRKELLNVKVKVSPQHAKLAHRESRGTARLLNLGARWCWVVSITPRPLYPEKEKAFRRLGELQELSGQVWKITRLLLYRGSNTAPSSPWIFAVPTKTSGSVKFGLKPRVY